MAPLALVAAALLLGAGGALAQDGGARAGGRPTYAQVLADTPRAPPELSAVAVFPEDPTHALKLGSKVSVLLGLRNDLDTPVNVTFAAGSLSAPNLYQQDTGGRDYGSFSVTPGSEITLPYMFFVNQQLGPQPYGLALSVFVLGEDGARYAVTAFNSTVRLVDPTDGSWLDMQGVAMLALALGGGAAVMAMAAPSGKAKGKGAAKAKAAPRLETGTAAKVASPADRDEWLQGTALGKKKEEAKPKPKAKK